MKTQRYSLVIGSGQKKRRKKKDPAAQQKGYIHAGSLSLSLGVDHAAAGALQLSGMGFDGSLPIPYANS